MNCHLSLPSTITGLFCDSPPENTEDDEDPNGESLVVDPSEELLEGGACGESGLKAASEGPEEDEAADGEGEGEVRDSIWLELMEAEKETRNRLRIEKGKADC